VEAVWYWISSELGDEAVVHDGVEGLREVERNDMDKHGVSLTDQLEVKNRWLERTVQSAIVTDQTVLGRLSIPADSEEAHAYYGWRSQQLTAVHRLKEKKAPGAGNVTAEEILYLYLYLYPTDPIDLTD